MSLLDLQRLRCNRKTAMTKMPPPMDNDHLYGIHWQMTLVPWNVEAVPLLTEKHIPTTRVMGMMS